MLGKKTFTKQDWFPESFYRVSATLIRISKNVMIGIKKLLYK